jgi:hypothetical protein
MSAYQAAIRPPEQYEGISFAGLDMHQVVSCKEVNKVITPGILAEVSLGATPNAHQVVTSGLQANTHRNTTPFPVFKGM